MAAVSGPARHSRVSMSVSMSLMQGGTQTAPQGAILAAAAPYYQTPAIPTDVQPDRPIGYGAFGVVWHGVWRGNNAHCRVISQYSHNTIAFAHCIVTTISMGH
ncbi:Serine/threonine kinase NLK [Papilio xuthus]|uniref:Serine/threonine kinase NLK n=1 Tax=Papilio xuthus TaxID=66420 RepID=A0A194QI37_PAPXU|nr:Serine/threonine kinase NLK [Papilio xuthus]